jgi:Helicase conserved C-terminal domain
VNRTAPTGFAIPNINAALSSEPDVAQELKEAVCDALVNGIAAKVSGLGEFGSFVFGQRPRDQFASGFLLNQMSATGEDESSDIRIPVHGASLKLRTETPGSLTIQPHFSVYIRVLPTWDDLRNEVLGLRPKPRLTRQVRQEVNAEAFRRADAARNAGDTRTRRTIYQEIVRTLMVERGVRFESPTEPVIAIRSESAGDAREDDVPAQRPSRGKARSEDNPGDETRVEVAETVDGAIYPDELCSTEEIPMKFRRLEVHIPPLELPLTGSRGDRVQLARDHAVLMGRAIEAAYDTFMRSQEGVDWCWRKTRLRPSAFRSRQAWDSALATLRAVPPNKSHLWPDQSPEISIEWATSPVEDGVIHAAIGLLHRTSGAAGESEGDGGLYQVRLAIDVQPRAALIPYVLERIKPAYDIQGFHSLPAAGWNAGVNEQPLEGGTRLTTTWSPRYVLPRIVPNRVEGLDLTFETLSKPDNSVDQLDLVPNAFERWIEEQRTSIDPAMGVDAADVQAIARERAKFEQDIAGYRSEVEDLRVGISVLKESQAAWRRNPQDARAIPFRAWYLINRAFLETGKADNKTSWRLFQLGFVLANIVSPSTRLKEFEKYYAPNVLAIESASLLYFATGGGKSEAFFGLLIFTLFLDRMRGKHRGLSALIRYPLRLLTAQQARRLAKVLAKAEIVRRLENIAGAPFEIGFWVGSGSTPNRIANGDKVMDEFKCIPTIESPEHADEATNLDDSAYYAAQRDYNKLPKCPFCERATALRRYPNEFHRLGIVCLSPECEWNQHTRGDVERPLPFLLVDYDIYRAAPSILLGTIDKLALIGQHWSTINRIGGMFGLARLIDGNGLLETPYDLNVEKAMEGRQTVAPSFSNGVEVFFDPVPSLIIQDEAHLLEESLGTFAGLFETTLYQWFRSLHPIMGDRMSTKPNEPEEIRLPKVVCATATISDPDRQIRVLYQKNVRQFPRKGTRLYRSFYANPSRFETTGIERNEILSRPTTGPKDIETYAPWARVYVSLLTNGRPHTTASVMILGAFTAIITVLLRDLCSTDPARQASAVRFLASHLSPGPLAARHAAVLGNLEAGQRFDVIAAAVDLHRVALTYVTNKKGGDQILSALPGIADRQHRDFGATALVESVRTDLISGGVESGTVEEIVRKAEQQFDPRVQDVEDTLRMIVATSAVSHGVDVENFNSMFFAGMPTAIDEFIQASSRIGRTHVGFSMLIPTPQNRRDRFIYEVHETFNRFLERMIAPPAIERWADRAIVRIIPSLTQNWLIGKIYQEQFVKDSDPTKRRVRIFSKVSYVRSLVNRMKAAQFIDELESYIAACVGLDAEVGGAQSQRQIMSMMIRDRIREFVRLLDLPMADGDLSDFWEQFRANIDSPMTSLRDVDAPGTVRPFVTARKADAKERFVSMMRFIREGGTTRPVGMIEVETELRND